MLRILRHEQVAIALLFGLAACHQSKPKLTDEQVQRLRVGLPGMSEECLQKARQGRIEAIPDGVEECYQLTDAQQFRGLWIDAFEDQRFCPELTLASCFNARGPEVWIDFKGKRPFDSSPPTGKVYVIDFIGRRTVKAGAFGHFGSFPHTILVDRLISVAPAK